MKWDPFLTLAAIALWGATGLWGAGDARIIYSKSFPNSVPAFVMVTLEKSGDAEYREAVDDPLPLKFKMTEADAQTVFGLAEKLGYFKRPLESPLKVAFMGTKTFRYENGAGKNEVKFNFSEDPSAQALLDWFERMSESAQHRIELERAAKYDRLGVMKALTLLESAMDRKRIVAPEQFLPILDRVSKSESYMHAARAMAAEIGESIRNSKPAANQEPPGAAKNMAIQ
jgi:hypothetical protein